MRMPYPFQHFVDLAEEPNVVVQIIIDMPCPHNMSVHLANEHGTGTGAGAHTSDEQSMLHLRAHLYGEFRKGAEHFHVRGESA